jgi:hypothetical protein
MPKAPKTTHTPQQVADELELAERTVVNPSKRLFNKGANKDIKLETDGRTVR